MANSNGIITAPVSLLQDLPTVLGIGGGLGYIITHANINKWAKYKPFRSSTISFLSDSDRDTANMRTGYALNMHSFTLQNAASSYSAPWEYLRPNDGTSEYFRLLDFHKYRHNTDAWPLMGSTEGAAHITLNGPFHMEALIDKKINLNTGYLSMSFLGDADEGEEDGLLYPMSFSGSELPSTVKDLYNYYPGILLVKNGVSAVALYTSNTPVSSVESTYSKALYVNAPVAPLRNYSQFGIDFTVDVIPCLVSETTNETWVTSGNRQIVTFDGIYASGIRVREPEVNLEFTTTYLVRTSVGTVRAECKNLSDGKIRVVLDYAFLFSDDSDDWMSPYLSEYFRTSYVEWSGQGQGSGELSGDYLDDISVVGAGTGKMVARHCVGTKNVDIESGDSAYLLGSTSTSASLGGTTYTQYNPGDDYGYYPSTSSPARLSPVMYLLCRVTFQGVTKKEVFRVTTNQ